MARILGFFLNCGLGVLIFLSLSALQQGPEAPVAVPPQPHSDWAADFPERIDRVTAALSQVALPLPTPTMASQGAGAMRWLHRRYDLTLPKPESLNQITQLFDVACAAAPGVTLHVSEETDGAIVQVGVDGLLTHTVTLHWLPHRPRAVIIIGDLGRDLLIARALAGIDAPVTFAIKPFQPFSKEVAELATLFHLEVLLQLEPEADHRPDNGPSPASPTAAERGSLSRWLAQNLAAVPHAVGITSRFQLLLAGDHERRQWLLKDTKEKNLFVVDTSDTSPRDTCEMAASMAVGCADNTVVLDDTDDEQVIQNELRAVVEAARTRGDTIATGHATQAALAALRAVVPAFAAAGVDLVPASTVVRDRSLSPR
ncbi:MAG: divergent polysaccharide deacetylase family protein [Candidatus Binatia bacterium]